MAPQPVILINAFEVPEGQDEAFIEGWERSRAFLSKQPGYLSTRLHRALVPDAEFRFVNIAQWESVDSFRAATAQPEFQAGGVPQRFHASLYTVVRDDSTVGTS
jgi:heme oxygenase (mycobilin-producing)